MASIYDKSSLVLIPSGTKTGKVYSQKPVSGDGDFTFTRSSAATRVNADGFIEKETQNLLYQSNYFDSGFWVKASTIVTSGQSGYDGSSDAWLLSKSTSGGRINQYVTSSGVQTLSFYAKANTLNWLRFITIGGVTMNTFFDLQNGAIGTTNAIDTQIQSIGNGWYRCSIALSQSITEIRIYPADADGDTSGTSGSIYIQDAQLEQGLVARDYIETTTPVEGGITDNVPRLDYTDSSCPALLLEPQRTNLVTQSEYIGAWTGFGGVQTITDNYATSPEGLQNAARVQLERSPSLSRIQLSVTGTSNGVAFVYSVYLKANSGSPYVYLQAGPNFSTAIEVTNEWQRYELIGTANGSTTTCIIGISDSVSGTTETADILVYGAQLESLASYATSYIPTYGSSVTRVADVDCETANPDTSLFGQTEGTIFCEYTPVSDDTTNQSRFIRLRNSSNSNQVYMQHNAANNINAVVFNGSNQFVGQTSTGYASVGNTYKFALAYKDGDYAFYANGVQIDTGTATGLGTLAVDRLDLDNVNISKSSKVNQALVFKTRLSNEELAALTTI